MKKDRILKKKSIVSIIFTTLIITILILSGPAKAIDVLLYLPLEVDAMSEQPITFSVSIKINDNEFLPFMYANITFDDGTNKITCKISEETVDEKGVIKNCDFLRISEPFTYGVVPGFGEGYGYGYNANDEYGKHEFGYGYGYGASGENGGYGEISFTLTINPVLVPATSIGKTVHVEARVYGGTEDNYNYFKGTGSFKINTSEIEIPIPDITRKINLNVSETEIEIPANALPEGVDKVLVNKIPVSTTYNPPSNLKTISTLFEFKLGNTTQTTFSQPVTIKIPYSQTMLDTVGGNADNLRPYFFDESTSSWTNTGLTFVSVDTVNQKVEFTTTHFTVFAVFLVSSVTDSGTSLGGGGDTAATISKINYNPSEEELVPIPTTTIPSEEKPSATEGKPPEETKAPTGITGMAVADFFRENKKVAIPTTIAVIAILSLLGFALFGKGGFGKGIRNAIKGNKILEKAKLNVFFFLFMHFNYIPKQ